MLRASFGLIRAVLIIAAVARAQSAPPDAQALQALVAEIHQLRLDLQSTTVITQRVQIVLYRVQTQTTLVTRASSRLDEARSAWNAVENERKRVTDLLPGLEDNARTQQNPAERTNQEHMIAEVKLNIQRLSADEQRQRSRVMDAESAYRAEQGKLADLQDQLDRLDKLLDSLTRK